MASSSQSNEPLKLLAKSGDNGIMVFDHCSDTEQVAQHLFVDNWLKCWCEPYKVDEQEFLLHLRIACLFHDIGKASHDFYGMISQTSKKPQSVTHEHISALVVSLRDGPLANPCDLPPPVAVGKR